MTNIEYAKKYYLNGKIKEERTNFLFTTEGTMVYDFKFDSYWDAMIDAIKNHGENIDDMISLVFPEKVDHPIVKEKLLKELN